MTDEPEWLTAEDLVDVHRLQRRMFGGGAGIRDRGALESALSRPINKHRYEGAALPELAAAYAFGIVRNHPFVDGNKRLGFLAMVAFLVLNDVAFAPDPVEATAMMLALAAGEIDEDGLARWIRDGLGREAEIGSR